MNSAQKSGNQEAKDVYKKKERCARAMPLRPRYVVRVDNLNIIDKMTFLNCVIERTCVYTVMVCGGHNTYIQTHTYFACISVYYHRDALLLSYEYVR